METWYGRRAGTEGAVKNYGADKAFPVENFEKELAKLVGGHEKLYYRFGVDAKLDQQILSYLSVQRFQDPKPENRRIRLLTPTV